MTTTSMTSATNESTKTTSITKRYHPALVSLHWLVAILIFATVLFAGEEGEGGRALSVGGFPPIGIHMILGITTLVLLTIRLIVRWLTKHPDWASCREPLPGPGWQTDPLRLVFLHVLHHDHWYRHGFTKRSACPRAGDWNCRRAWFRQARVLDRRFPWFELGPSFHVDPTAHRRSVLSPDLQKRQPAWPHVVWQAGCIEKYNDPKTIT